MIDQLRIMLKMLNVDYEICDFNNCHLLVPNVTDFIIRSKKSAFSHDTFSVILSFLNNNKIKYEIIGNDNIYAQYENFNLEITTVCNVEDQIGFAIFKN